MFISSNAQRKLGIILSYVNMAFQIIISLFFTPIMLNLLGQNEYGLYSLSSSTIAYLNLIALGLSGAYTRYYIRYRVVGDDIGIRKLNGMYLLFYLGAAIVALSIGGILISNLGFIFVSLTSAEIAITKILMALLVFNLAISFPCSLFSSFIGANEHFIVQRAINIAKTILSPLIVIPVLLSGYGSIGYTIVVVTVNILMEIVNIVYAMFHLKMKFCFHGLKVSLLKEVFIFSFFILLNQIIDQVNSNMGNFLLGIFQGSASVAVYGVARTITNYFFSFSTAISSVYAPSVNQLVARKANGSELTDLMVNVGRTQFFVMALILSGLVFFGKPFIALWAGPSYSDAYYIILILCVPVIVPLIQNVGIEIQRAMNKHQVRSIAYLIMALINIAISIPMIISYGAIGAAIGTCISYIVCNIVFMNVYYQKGLRLDMFHFWREISKIFPALIPPILFGCLIIYAGFNLYKWPIFIIFVLSYIFVYFVSLWFLGLSKIEKMKFIRVLKRLRQ